MRSSEISSTASAVNPSDQAKQREHRLEWWSRGDGLRYWAFAARGRYVVLCDPATGNWILIFHKLREQLLGVVVASLSEARDLAELHSRANERAVS